jgi:pimeloyl-ACP methyl ester carboxylesterase
MDPILLLHGALGSRDQLEPLRESLAAGRDVHCMNFSGHGGAPFPSAPLAIPLFADDVLWWMKSREILRVRIVGYSMGGYVGLYLARHFPERISSVATFATKFRWNKETAAKESAMLDPAAMRAKVPAFAAALAARHSEARWEELVRATAAMMLELGETPALSAGDLRAIEQPALLGVGDRDAMVSIDETAEAARDLRHGSLLVLPSTPHPIEKIPVGLLASALRGFFDNP